MAPCPRRPDAAARLPRTVPRSSYQLLRCAWRASHRCRACKAETSTGVWTQRTRGRMAVSTTATGQLVSPAVSRVDAAAFVIPTDGPESDGTIEWASTTIVVVKAEAGGLTGLGYTYGHDSAATLIRRT